ncbi:cytochrome b [Pseudoalteromonas aurantia]|uniref:Cytochrome b561 bacterial/Ni-hydrogenase domain-containing protein n=1 Tax=Pseudoalteromonas aurantia 208 TaxID=1314867 RepID=A0ABR9ECS3_9GAMM|nr:cytochrome b/b6 domain-containing protein [Pseudoalteromonas aurantia]MBE0368149.1 hypothetical protein [Pseudoalteromonas aurantia 208]
MKPYSNLLVLLHWILVPSILIALFMGNDIASLSNDLELKVDRIKVHTAAGVFIGALFVIRLIVRMTSTSIGALKENESSLLIHKLASLTHRTLYLLVFLIVLSGIGMSIQIDMFEIMRLGETLPENLSELPARRIHGVLTLLLTALVVFHIFAALYHHFVLKNGNLSRMWFYKRKE